MVLNRTGKMAEHFAVREKSGNFTQNTQKSENWKNIRERQGKMSA